MMDIYERFFLAFVLVLVGGVFVGALIINAVECFLTYHKKRKSAQARVDYYKSHRQEYDPDYDYFGVSK